MAEPIYPQFFHSGQLNAPQMTGDAGSEGQILSVLDACLITGFSPSTAASVAIEGDFIKITYGVSHKYMKHQFLDISGASSGALNGKHRIVSVTPTTVTIAKKDITVVSGTITTKLSPLDWESMFGNDDPLKRAYRSKDLTSTRTVLYLDCELKAPSRYHSTMPIKKAKVDMCRDMKVLGEQIDSYTDYTWKDKGADYVDGSYHWFQAGYTTVTSTVIAGARPWVLLGDGKFFYFLIGFGASAGTNRPEHWNLRSFYFFGDIPKLSSADKFNCLLNATNVDLPRISYNTNTEYNYTLSPSFRDRYAVFIKPLNGIGVLTQAGFDYTDLGASWSGGSGGLSTINPLNFGLVYSDVAVKRVETPTTFYYAGKLPYVKAISNELRYVSEGLDLTWDESKLLTRMSYGTDYNSYNSYLAFDVLESRIEDLI